MASPRDKAHYLPLPLQLEMKDNGHTAVLLAPFTFIEWEDALEPRIRVDVPAGFETDFNSVPRGLWNFFPPWQYPEAAVVHDYLYRDPTITQRGEADRVHRKILEILGCPGFKRWTSWLALRGFGWKPWNKVPEDGDL